MFAESMQTKNSSKLQSLLSTGLNRSSRVEPQKTVPIRCQSKSIIFYFCHFCFYLPIASCGLICTSFQNIYLYIFIIASSPLWVDLPLSLEEPLEMSPPCPHLFTCFQLLSKHVLFFGLPKPIKLTHTHHSFMPPVAIYDNHA